MMELPATGSLGIRCENPMFQTYLSFRLRLQSSGGLRHPLLSINDKSQVVPG